MAFRGWLFVAPMPRDEIGGRPLFSQWSLFRRRYCQGHLTVDGERDVGRFGTIRWHTEAREDRSTFAAQSKSWRPEAAAKIRLVGIEEISAAVKVFGAEESRGRAADRGLKSIAQRDLHPEAIGDTLDSKQLSEIAIARRNSRWGVVIGDDELSRVVISSGNLPMDVVIDNHRVDGEDDRHDRCLEAVSNDASVSVSNADEPQVGPSIEATCQTIKGG
jgi:hypothetical protein